MFKLVGSTLLEQERERGASEERRAYVRFPANMKAHCMPLAAGAGAGWVAQVKDVSSLGIGLILHQKPELATLVEIELHRRNGSYVRTVLARVVHVELDTSRTWLVGCAFVRELTSDELSAFAADAVHPTGPDLRRWQRFPCDVETACYTNDTAPGERRSGRIVNISAGGIGLALRCEFSKGTLLFLDMAEGLGLGRGRLLVRVVQVMEKGSGSWFHGCEFAEELSEEEIRGLVR